MIQPPPRRRKEHSEDGYVLVAVVFMMLILVLSLSVAVPKVREDIQRDRDEETMQRGKQYIRAIQLYYRKFHAYPPSIDALVKTNDVRFLRKQYIDPTTGKDDWKPVMWGQNKTPMAMGFFGQPLAAAIGGGIGPSGGNTGINGSPGTGVTNTTTSGGLFNNSPSGSSSSFGSSSFGSSSSAFGSSTTPVAGATGTTDQNGAGGTGGTDANGNPISGTTGSTGTTGSPGSTGSGFGSSNNPTGNGQAFGGAGIIGFSPQSPKQSIYVYKKKNHYNEWEFLYTPQMDQQQIIGGNAGAIGQPASSTTNPIGSSSFGSSSSSGSLPNSGGTTTPTTPTSPQQ